MPQTVFVEYTEAGDADQGVNTQYPLSPAVMTNYT
jgi:hypothetical protein